MTDTRRVNIHDPSEVAYWLKVLNTTHAQLFGAVTAVGTDAAAIRNFLTRGSSSEPPAAEQRPDGG